MPSVSPKQQRYLYMKFGSGWVHQHGFDVLDTSRKKLAATIRKGK